MNRKDKVLIGIGVFLAVSLVYFGIGFGEPTGEVVSLSEGDNVTNGHHTVAVCDDNGYCQDYKVVCENGSLVEMQIVEGADFQHDEGWVDLRSEAERGLCS